MYIEAQMFEAKSSRARQICRENALEAELDESKKRERRAEIKGGEHVLLLEEKRWDFTTLVYSVDILVG